jgi:hypothetical protein
MSPLFTSACNNINIPPKVSAWAAHVYLAINEHGAYQIYFNSLFPSGLFR